MKTFSFRNKPKKAHIPAAQRRLGFGALGEYIGGGLFAVLWLAFSIPVILAFFAKLEPQEQAVSHEEPAQEEISTINADQAQPQFNYGAELWGSLRGGNQSQQEITSGNSGEYSPEDLERSFGEEPEEKLAPPQSGEFNTGAELWNSLHELGNDKQ